VEIPVFRDKIKEVVKEVVVKKKGMNNQMNIELRKKKSDLILQEVQYRKLTMEFNELTGKVAIHTVGFTQMSSFCEEK